jgi:hypothetical protein
MSINKKYFLRNVLIGGLFWFAISVVQWVIEFGWIIGITKSVASGLLLGLLWAFFGREDYSKPVYPMDIDRSQFDVEEIQSDLQPEEPTYSFIILWSLLIIVLTVVGIYLTRDYSLLIAALFFLVLSVIWLVYRLFSRMIILQDGIEYRAIIYRIRISWEEIERIEKRGNNWFLIYHTDKIYGVPIIVKLLKIYEVDRRLDLSSLTFDFIESEIAKAIFYHARQIPFMSTSKS